MIVHGLEIPILSDTYRVKMARNRLIEIRLTFPVCFLNSAFTSTIGVVTGKDTIFAVHDRGNRIAFLIDISYALLMNDLLSFRG